MDWEVLGGDRIRPHPDYIPRQPALRPAGLPLPAARRWARWLPGLVVPGEGREEQGRAGHSGRPGGLWSHGQAEAGAERPRHGGAERAGRGSCAAAAGRGDPAAPPRCSGRWRSGHAERARGAWAGGPAGLRRCPRRPLGIPQGHSAGCLSNTRQRPRGSFRAW